MAMQQLVAIETSPYIIDPYMERYMAAALQCVGMVRPSIYIFSSTLPSVAAIVSEQTKSHCTRQSLLTRSEPARFAYNKQFHY